MSPARAPKLLPDRLEKAQSDELVDRWVYSAFPKDNWVARKPSNLTHAEHPGTALEIGDELFEILVVEEAAEPGYAVRYGLKTWNPAHAVRRIVHYAPETQSQAAAASLDERGAQELRARLLWLFPLVGLAPGPVQNQWGKRTALNMAWISAGSAAVLIALAYALFQVLGRHPEHPTLLYLIDYFAVESFLRLLWIAVSGKPHGTLVLALPYLFWKAAAQPGRRAPAQARPKFWVQDDEVIRRPVSRALVIRSMLFDEVLAGPGPVRFEGAMYRPLRWHKEGKGLRRRWVYELEEASTATGATGHEYTHPRTPERQKQVETYTEHLDLAQSFALLWGAYPRRDQIRLEILYRYAAARSTALTAWILLAEAVLQLAASIYLHATMYAAVGPVYLIFESSYRLYRSKVQGEPAGSLLGYLLRLVIRPPR